MKFTNPCANFFLLFRASFLFWAVLFSLDLYYFLLENKHGKPPNTVSSTFSVHLPCFKTIFPHFFLQAEVVFHTCLHPHNFYWTDKHIHKEDIKANNYQKASKILLSVYILIEDQWRTLAHTHKGKQWEFQEYGLRYKTLALLTCGFVFVHTWSLKNI
jgi:hypothetical protein